MTTFAAANNKDSANAFIKALLGAGFERVKKLKDADFLLYDSENVGRRWQIKKDYLESHPGFIYPHTPQTCWLWDGVYKALPVECNFVAGSAQKAAMQSYGYPYRIETVGFPRCNVLPFQSFKGSKPRLLFVPPRPRRDGGRQENIDLSAFYFIVENDGYFESITVCRLAGQLPEFETMALDRSKYIDIVTNPRAVASPAGDMLERIDRADLIISQNTPAYLAVAQGKPAIFYGESHTPETTMGRAPVHYREYESFLRFPLDLDEMNIDQVLSACRAPSEEVEDWKKRNIGGAFDAEKFIGIVKECLTK